MKNGETEKYSFTTAFIETLKELKSLFEDNKVNFAILGGLAAGAWGKSRATDDIDLVVQISREKFDAMTSALKKNKYNIRVSGPANPPDLFEITTKKNDMPIRVDIMLANIPYQEEALKRKVWLKIFDIELPFVSAEDLVIHKLISKRPVDIYDIENIFKFNFKNLDLDYMKKWAREWNVEDLLDEFIRKYSSKSPESPDKLT